MNYLAHAFLSFGQAQILVGNMTSDFIKGKKKFDYPLVIQQGISLHRSIDEFTDRHAQTLEAKKVFRPIYGLYSGAFMDIVYDHFLAKDPKIFASPGDLADFATQTYDLITPFQPVFPEKFQKMFHYMQLQNWLYNYQYREAINNSFRGLVHRSAYMHEHESAFRIFEANYDRLKMHYEIFFPELRAFAFNRLRELTAA